jgi:hypothetical protein
MLEINLTQTEIDAFTEMGITNIETYLKSVASAHISQKVDEQFMSKTLEEKQTLLS